MTPAMESAPDSSSTRRWPRYQVKLPVGIASGTQSSRIAGLVTEISQRGLALYGGVQLETGDLMEVEFPTSSQLRITGVVRNRTGYCFGLEFLTLLDGTPNDEYRRTRTQTSSNAVRGGEVIPAEENLVALFNYRHQAYVRDKEQEIERLRQKAFKIRQLRHEIEQLVRSRSAQPQNRR